MHGEHSYNIIIFSVVAWTIIATLLGIALKQFSLIPGKVQNLIELVFEFIYDLADSTIGSHEDAKPYYPLLICIFLFIFISNLIGLIPGTIAPTANINTTLALALIVFFYYQYLGFTKRGTKYIKSFFEHIDLSVIPRPMRPVMGVFGFVIIPIIEILSQFIRPVSLSLRLFGNMIAKETLLGMLSMLVGIFLSFQNPFMKLFLTPLPALLAPLIVLLGVLVSFIQACVFLFLTIIYIAGAIKSHEH